MGRMIPIILAMVVLNIALVIFTCSSWDAETGVCTGTAPYGASSNETVINFLLNPTSADSGSLWETLFGQSWGLLAAIIGGAAVIVGAIFMRNETPVYMAAGLAVITSVYPAIKLWQLINGTSLIGDSISRKFIATLICGSLIVGVIFSVVDWTRGTD